MGNIARIDGNMHIEFVLKLQEINNLGFLLNIGIIINKVSKINFCETVKWTKLAQDRVQ